MQEPTIGIKIANGSYFPILEEKSVGKKRLILTTVKDRQESVKIDLYKSDQETLETAMYIGSLILENIQTGEKGEPEIELILGIDDEGNLTATGGDLGSGERQSLSVSLDTLSEESEFEIPDFDLDASIEPSSEISSLEEEDFSLEDFAEEAEEPEEASEEGAFEEAEEEAEFEEEEAFEEEAFGEGEFEEEALEEGPFEEESFEEETLEETGFGEVEEEFDLGDEFGEEEPAGEDTFITEEGIEEEFEEEFEEAGFADEGFGEESFEEEPFEEESFGEEPFEEEPVEEAAEEPEEEEEERRVRPALIAVFVFLGVVIIGLLAFLLYRSFQGEETPPLEARGETPRTEQPAETETGGAAGAGESETAGDTTGVGEAEAPGEEPGDEAAADEEAAEAEESVAGGTEAGAPAGEAAEEEGVEPAPGTEGTGTLGGVWYWVKWGDTLWDLSYSFYRTPWLYGMIAKVNNIQNPDLIYANSKLYIPEK